MKNQTTLINTNYYPFGMPMPGRSYRWAWLKGPNYINDQTDVIYSAVSDLQDPNTIASEGRSYRYGFNGKEKDDEVKGKGIQQDYGFRIYDSRLARFLSVDPLYKKYPWNSVYAFAENTPIWGTDLDGKELQISNTGQFISGPLDIQKINAENIKNNLQQVIEYSCNGPTPPPTQPSIELQFKTEIGFVGGGKIRILGKGVGSKVGISQPLTTVTFTDEGTETSTGGNRNLDASFNAGLFAAGGNISSEGDGGMYGSLGVLKTDINTDGSSNASIQLFEISAAFLIGGTISLNFNFNKPVTTEPEPSSDSQRDNTYVNQPIIEENFIGPSEY